MLEPLRTSAEVLMRSGTGRGAFEHGALFLGVGSFLLFAGWGFALPFGGWGWLFLFCWSLMPALGFHATAWHILGHAAMNRAMERPFIFGSFLASLLAFGLSLPYLAAGVPYGWIVYLFPVVPSVWAPVVLAHSAMFTAASVDLPHPKARVWSQSGCVILAILSVVGLWAQLGLIDIGLWMFILGGATFVPYLMIAAAWSHGGDPPRARSPYARPRGFAA